MKGQVALREYIDKSLAATREVVRYLVDHVKVKLENYLLRDTLSQVKVKAGLSDSSNLKERRLVREPNIDVEKFSACRVFHKREKRVVNYKGFQRAWKYWPNHVFATPPTGTHPSSTSAVTSLSRPPIERVLTTLYRLSFFEKIHIKGKSKRVKSLFFSVLRRVHYRLPLLSEVSCNYITFLVIFNRPVEYTLTGQPENNLRHTAGKISVRYTWILATG